MRASFLKQIFQVCIQALPLSRSDRLMNLPVSHLKVLIHDKMGSASESEDAFCLLKSPHVFIIRDFGTLCLLSPYCSFLHLGLAISSVSVVFIWKSVPQRYLPSSGGIFPSILVTSTTVKFIGLFFCISLPKFWRQGI